MGKTIMRIALVAPKWHRMVNSYPPLGLGYLAAVMEQEGHQTAIFDLGLEPETPLAEAVDAIVDFCPDLVGVTAMTNNYASAAETMTLLKERLSCPIVLGGPHATLFPEQLVADSAADYVIVGEGEETLRELTRILALWLPPKGDGRPPAAALAAIHGLVWMHNGYDGREVIERNPERPLIKDLDALPFPARSQFALPRYTLQAPNGEPMATLLSSRGCPFNCSYCFKGIVGRTYRQRSPENVLRELRLLVEDYQYRHIYFIDDLFTYDTKRLVALCEGIVAAGLDIRWQCLARVDRVTPEVLRLMHRAGCREIHYGIESGNAEILRRIGKAITLDQVRQAVAWTAEAGILVKGYFMLGLPGDTTETMQQTIDFASELAALGHLDQAMFSLTTPFPGTRLWDELLAREPNLALEGDFSQAFYYAGVGDTGFGPFFNLSQVSDEELMRWVSVAQAQFQEAKRRRKYIRALGSPWGDLCYRLSTIKLARRIGHAALNHPLVRDVLRRGTLRPGALRRSALGSGALRRSALAQEAGPSHHAQHDHRHDGHRGDGHRQELAQLGHYNLQEELAEKWQ
jgi:anaerobic magnesium-protoporphyrin IX monomethyl ester cyclase